MSNNDVIITMLIRAETRGGSNEWVWFSPQFEEAEKQKQERERAENFQALLQAEEEALITNEEEFDCPICFDTVEPGEGVTLRNCLHRFCKSVFYNCIELLYDCMVL